MRLAAEVARVAERHGLKPVPIPPYKPWEIRPIFPHKQPHREQEMLRWLRNGGTFHPVAPKAEPVPKPPTEKPRPAFVYFVQAGPGGLIKIGTTRDAKARIRNLETMSPVPLVRLAVIDGGRDVEQKLHRRFRRLREHGEWFRPEPRLLDFIAAKARA